ncbi:hypothetical protein [Embleya sp. NPDC059237]|uniref:hypothetical protein n=1 Tax=Embleya sp. NPDC059237 TaxID=3346784 RepID=UPI0036C98B4C
MTVAVLTAHLLADILDRHRARSGLARHYHRRLSRLHDTPWNLATTADLAFPTTEGPPPTASQRILARHLDHVLAAGTRHRHTQAAFLGVLTMTSHPVALLTPRVALSATTTRHRALAPADTPPPPTPDPQAVRGRRRKRLT